MAAAADAARRCHRQPRPGGVSGRHARRPLRPEDADFLIRDGHRYRVADTKLARSPTVTALLQLAAYARCASSSGVPVLPTPRRAPRLGDGTIVRYRVGELPVYRYSVRTAIAGRPLHRGRRGERVQACFRCPRIAPSGCAPATICYWSEGESASATSSLEDGITTIAELAESHRAGSRLTTKRAGLTAQAKLQIRQRDRAPLFHRPAAA